jgi:hypothetical protein
MTVRAAQISSGDSQMKKALLCRSFLLLCLMALASCGGVSTKDVSLTPAQQVAAAKAALAIGYAEGDSLSTVTQNLTLPATGLDGSTIAWVSSNPAVVSNAGVVTRPLTNDVNLTLTATITVASASDTKVFPVTVKAQLTEAQAVAAAKAALDITYASGDSASSVTQNLTLPATGMDGSSIAWASGNPALVSDAGIVQRPVTGDGNVTLTATITVGSSSDTKLFPLVVKAQMSDLQAVAAAKAALQIGYASGDSASSVTQNLILPPTGIDGATISWQTSNAAVVTTEGMVSQPQTGPANVTLTASITVGAASDTKTFPIVVQPQVSDAQAVDAVKAALQIGYAPGDAATTVTQNLSLPLSGAYAAVISWSSSDPSIVGVDGSVSRPVTGDVPVTLTATITLPSASDTKNFIVTVKAQMTDDEAVAAAKAALQIGYAQGDSANSVSQNLTLPTSGSSQCSIGWTSSDPDVVSIAGTVQRPSIGDALVTLTATITSHQASDTAEFGITVKGQLSDQDAVAAAKAALDIVYAGGDSALSVTQNVGLPVSGADNCAVTWDTDTPETISATGVVIQPSSEPVSVTLTATISSNAISDTKVFHLNVQPSLSDADAVAADKAALAIGFASGDTASSVTGNIVLPTAGTNGSTISWSSSNPDVISISGGVIVPSDQDANVTMTATISRGSASDSADFPLTVKARLLNDWYAANAISPGEGAIEVEPGNHCPHSV